MTTQVYTHMVAIAKQVTVMSIHTHGSLDKTGLNKHCSHYNTDIYSHVAMTTHVYTHMVVMTTLFQQEQL